MIRNPVLEGAHARAHVPILDEEFEHPIHLQTEKVPKASRLGEDARAEFRRLAELTERQYALNNSTANCSCAASTTRTWSPT